MENEGNSKTVLRNLGWDRANMAGASKIKSCKVSGGGNEQRYALHFFFLSLELQYWNRAT